MVPEIPGYTVERVLGQGGMATVYLAIQQSLGRRVALKLLMPALAREPVATERFLREARIAAMLHHPNIVDIHDVGIHDGVPYMAMAYEPGGTVAQSSSPADAPSHALRCVRDIATALDYAHRQGVVHRDVKPENILRRADDACVLSDFGIARAAEIKLALTGEGTSVGTPHYMSPEQWRGEQVDGRADLYSLGVVLFRLLTGRLPYEGGNGWTVGMQHMNAPVPQLPTTLQHLQGLVNDLLAKDPAARPQSGLEVVRRIDSFLSGQGEPITVTMPTPAPYGNVTTPIPTPSPMSTQSNPSTNGAGSTPYVLAAAAMMLIALLAWQPWRAPRVSESVSAPSATTIAAPAPTSIAVLPFIDLSPKQDQAYFSDGLSEELLDLLAKLPQLRVAGRSSSFKFRGTDRDLQSIGQKLGVARVLEGSVRKSGDRLRVSVQLLNCADGFHLWSETYDRRIEDVFALQDEIAQSVVAALKIKLLPSQKPNAGVHRTTNPDAYTEYLRGRQLLGKNSAQARADAVAALRNATEIDPEFAAAFARLAWAWMWASEYADSEQAMSDNQHNAITAAERAIAIDPTLADGYWARANLRTTIQWDWTGARADYDRALALEPGHSHALQGYASLLASLGRLPDAIAMARRVTETDPLLASSWQALGYFQEAAGDLEGARESQRRALALKPDFAFAHFRLAVISLQQNDHDRAARAFDATGFEPLQWLGEVLVSHARNDAAASDRAVAALEEKYAFNAAYQIAEAHAFRGDHDAAFAWLERAVKQRDGGLAEIKYDPLLRSLHDDPRFRTLLEKLGLPR